MAIFTVVISGAATHRSKTVSNRVRLKYGVLDGKAAIVGSYNLDPRSRFLNSEDIIAFESKTAVKSLVDE